MSYASRLMPFVQLEFTHALGPVQGRYVVAPEDGGPLTGFDTADVLLIDVVTARAASRRRARTPRSVTPDAEVPAVALALATHIKAGLAGDGDEAVRWVQACQEDVALQSAWVEDGLAVLNRAIRAHRAGCGDPYFTEMTATDPRAARIGYGAAREVSFGGWQHAFTVEPVKRCKLDHVARNAPAEVVAAALAGHPVAFQADELVLRALLDLDQGRTGCATLQLHAASRMLMAETSAITGGAAVDERLTGLPALNVRLEELSRRLALPDGDVALEGELHEAAAQLREVAEMWRSDALGRFRAGG